MTTEKETAHSGAVRTGLRASALATVLLGLAALETPAAAAAACEELANLALEGVSIRSAEALDSFTIPATNPGGTPTLVPGPFCRVAATAKPVPESTINFEVWLPPAESWNGKFRGEGSGGSAGSISYSAMAAGLRLNYATMANDNGHIGGSWTFSRNPEAVIDFGYRAQHVTTVAAKAIVAARYGSAPRYSYFIGCSQGGHHAQMEAQRFPEDYDGIIAGNGAHDWTGVMTSEVWTGVVSSVRGPAFDLPQPVLDLVNRATLERCAGRDGGLPTDAFLTDPRDCRFDPGELQCREGGDPAQCLTAEQVEAVRLIHAGPRDPATGALIAHGLERGSESGWRQFLVGGEQPGGSALSFYRDAVFRDPNHDFRGFDFGEDVALMEGTRYAGQTLPEILDATSPNYEPFRQRGAKLIMYHGWADPFIPPRFSVDLYRAIIRDQARRHDLPRAAALRQTQDFARLFMVPGFYHCSGGPGPNVFDMLPELERWVEQGIAPRRVTATRYVDNDRAKGAAFTRPLCPYPQSASYSGQGDPTEAGSFRCIPDGSPNGPLSRGFVRGLRAEGGVTDPGPETGDTE